MISSDGQHVAFLSLDLSLPRNTIGNGPFITDLNRTLDLAGVPVVGTLVGMHYSCPDDAGMTYFVAGSTGYFPGIYADGIRSLALNFSPVFLASVTGNTFFAGAGVTTTGSNPGQAIFPIAIPPIPGLIGLTIYLSAATFDPYAYSGIKGFTNAVAVTFQ